MMVETLVALVLAHALADFVLQTARMASEKADGQSGSLMVHAGIVGVTTAVVIGASSATALFAVLVVTGTHLLIDWGKAQFDRTLSAFLIDQAIHLATLIAVAWVWPGLWAAGLFGGAQWLPAVMAITAGLILAVRAGGFAVGLLMDPWEEIGKAGLSGAGRTIGYLERFLILLLALTGELGAIGFLIAAKSVLRYATVREGRKLSEYVIVGTLASFAWAILISAATIAVLGALPSIGILFLSR